MVPRIQAWPDSPLGARVLHVKEPGEASRAQKEVKFFGELSFQGVEICCLENQFRSTRWHSSNDLEGNLACAALGAEPARD